MNGLLRLDGKVVLITGADGPIGSATALRFAREGATLVLNDVVSRHLDRVVNEIVRVEGGRALIAMGDVTHPAHVERILREALDAFGAVDVLVNNAGPDPDTAVRCAASCADAVLPLMRERRAGRVVTVAPASAGQPESGDPHAGLVALTRKLALDVAPYGVTVNCVVPGVTTATLVPDSACDTLTAVVPMARLGEPREVAAALLFLASDDASYVTGQVLYVDGGLSVAA